MTTTQLIFFIFMMVYIIVGNIMMGVMIYSNYLQDGKPKLNQWILFLIGEILLISIYVTENIS